MIRARSLAARLCAVRTVYPPEVHPHDPAPVREDLSPTLSDLTHKPRYS
jgi:hypothetical protein